MTPTIERYIHADAPTPPMLRKLADICVSAASAQKALKSPPHLKGSHYFMSTVSGLEMSNEPVSESPEALEPVEIWDRLAGRVGRVRRKEGDIKLREWSLKIYHAYAAKKPTSPWMSAQTLYLFEWNYHQTLRAERRHRLLDAPGAEVRHIADFVLDFHIPEEMAAFWHAQLEVARITGPECDDIITTMTDHLCQLRADGSG